MNTLPYEKHRPYSTIRGLILANCGCRMAGLTFRNVYPNMIALGALGSPLGACIDGVWVVSDERGKTDSTRYRRLLQVLSCPAIGYREASAEVFDNCVRTIHRRYEERLQPLLKENMRAV